MEEIKLHQQIKKSEIGTVRSLSKNLTPNHANEIQDLLKKDC